MTTFAHLPRVFIPAASRTASMDSSLADSMKPHVFTTITSASLCSGVISKPDAASTPSICSASTWFLGQPRLTMPILYDFFTTDFSRKRLNGVLYHLASTLATTDTSKPCGQGKEAGHLFVRFPQAFRQGPGERPEQLKSQVPVRDQDIVQVRFADCEDLDVRVGNGVGRTRKVVDQRHLAEIVSRLEHGQGLLADVRDEFADAHFARGDHVAPVSGIVLGENDGVLGVSLLPDNLLDLAQLRRREVLEQGYVLQQIDHGTSSATNPK